MLIDDYQCFAAAMPIIFVAYKPSALCRAYIERYSELARDEALSSV